VDTDAGRALKALFVGTALRIDMVADIVTAVWRKALVNSALNGVTALSRRRLDVLREDAVARLAHSLMLECWQVAVTYGAEIPHAEVEALARWLSAYASATGTTSMYQDWMADSPNEHEAIYGDVVRLGRTHGVDTPLHEAIDALLAAGAPERKAEPADGC
jgi:2-dehydropantoate 2-reductase